jgi:hypothetical protein
VGSLQAGLLGIIFFLELNQRPALLQSLGEVLGLTILTLIGIYGLLGYRGSLTQQKRMLLWGVWIFGVYLWGQVLVQGEGISRAALINVVFIVVASSTVVLITRSTWQAALKAVVYPVLAFGLSYLITFVLVMAAGMPLRSLEVFSFNIAQAGVENRYLIQAYFPFSLALNYGNVSVAGMEWARATGYMREPGIYQAVVCVAYFGVDYVRGLRWRSFWKGALLLSLFLTFSTAGIGAFLAAALYYYVLANRDMSVAVRKEGGTAKGSQMSWSTSILAMFVIGAVGYWFVYTESFKFGLLRKLALGSGSSRVSAVSEATEALLAHPILGVGYTNKIGKGFSFLGVTGEIGVVGIILFLAVLILPLLPRIRRRDRILAFLIAPVLTALLAQPLFDKPFLYLILALVVAYPHESDQRNERAPDRQSTAT